MALLSKSKVTRYPMFDNARCPLRQLRQVKLQAAAWRLESGFLREFQMDRLLFLCGWWMLVVSATSIHPNIGWWLWCCCCWWWWWWRWGFGLWWWLYWHTHTFYRRAKTPRMQGERVFCCRQQSLHICVQILDTNSSESDRTSIIPYQPRFLTILFYGFSW